MGRRFKRKMKSNRIKGKKRSNGKVSIVERNSGRILLHTLRVQRFFSVSIRIKRLTHALRYEAPK